jgi:hypothetical protein
MKLERNALIHICSKICEFAQNHSSDEDAWDRSNLTSKMEHVSYVVACFISQNTKFGDEGVPFDIVLDELCGEILTCEQWEKKIAAIVSNYDFECAAYVTSEDTK